MLEILAWIGTILLIFTIFSLFPFVITKSAGFKGKEAVKSYLFLLFWEVIAVGTVYYMIWSVNYLTN